MGNLTSKPPSAVCLNSFLDDSYVGCSSSSIYDIVTFLSIVPDIDNKLVLTTKTKQRWKNSSRNTLIGNGEKLAKLFTHSRLIVLERVRASNTNFLHAIAKCCSVIVNTDENIFESSKTLHHAAQVIMNNQRLNSIQQLLSSHVTTHYLCPRCNTSSNSLSSTIKSIFIYHLHEKNSFTCATPLIWPESLDLCCPVCNERKESVVLPINNQIYHQCPSILMYQLSRGTLHSILNLHVALNDDKAVNQLYKPCAVLVVDEYNSISVIELDGKLVFHSSPYQQPVSYTYEKINELFDTSRLSVVFLRKV